MKRHILLSILVAAFVLVTVFSIGPTTRTYEISWPKAPATRVPGDTGDHGGQDNDVSTKSDLFHPKQSLFNQDTVADTLTNDNPITWPYLAVLVFLGLVIVTQSTVITYGMNQLAKSAPAWVLDMLQTLIESGSEMAVDFAEATPTKIDDELVKLIVEAVLKEMKTPQTMADAIYTPPVEAPPLG